MNIINNIINYIIDTIMDLLFNLGKLTYTPKGGNGIYYCTPCLILLYVIIIVLKNKLKKQIIKDNRRIFYIDILNYIHKFIIIWFILVLIAVCFIKEQGREKFISSDLFINILAIDYILLLIYIYVKQFESIISIITESINSIKYINSIKFKLKHLLSCYNIKSIIVFTYVIWNFIIIGTFIMILPMWKDNVISVDFDSNGKLEINTEIYNDKYEPIVIKLKDINGKTMSIATLSDADCYLASSTSTSKRINYPYNNTIIKLESINIINKLYIYDLNKNVLFNDNKYVISIKAKSYYDDVVLYNSFIKNGDKYEFKERKMEEKYACNHGAEDYDKKNNDNIGVFVLGLVFIANFFILPYIFLL